MPAKENVLCWFASVSLVGTCVDLEGIWKGGLTMGYAIKEIKFKLKRPGSSIASMSSTYSGSVGFKTPQSEFEAQKMALEWLKRKYPGWEVADLIIVYR